MTGSPIVLHVGYPKASSTFLQENLFGRPEHGYWPIFVDFASRVQLSDRLLDAPAFEFAGAELAALARDALAARPDDTLVPVISLETLVGIPYDATMATTLLYADRLKQVFPEAKILVIVREQRSVILSSYHQYIRGGGRRSLRDYVLAPGQSITSEAGWLGVYPAYYRYDKVIAHYSSVFGRERVLALPFELLRTDPRDYVRRISEFTGARTTVDAVDVKRVHSGIPATGVAPRRFLNQFLSIKKDNPFSIMMPPVVYWRLVNPAKRGIDRLARLLPSKHVTAREMRLLDAVLGDYYCESNRRTGELIGWDLAKLGYRC